jgi:hypothetical protein
VPGLHDEVINLTRDRELPFQPGAFVSTADFFKFLHRFFSGQDVEANASDVVETGFLKIESSLVVPIPRIERNSDGNVSGRSAASIACQLPQGELMPWSGNHPTFGSQSFHAVRRAVEMQLRPKEGIDLRDALRRIGCPSSLQYSIVYLFEEFLACIDDPPRCVAVLDLYECFAALNRLIRTDWPTYFDGFEDDPLRRRREQARLFEKNQLPSFIDALQNSFSLRLQRGIPQHERRDTAFNFRGGVSKFLVAMDVPLKCSLGLFRRMFGFAADKLDSPDFKQRFAGVTSVRIGQQTTAQFWCFSKKDLPALPPDPLELPIHLATFNLDLLHLYRPDSILDFLHEISHLYFGTFLSPLCNGIDRFHFAEEEHAESVRIRTEEVFAELITHLFVFEGDTQLYSKSYALGFSELQELVLKDSPPLRGQLGEPTSTERLAKGLTEAMFRAFLVSDSISQLFEIARVPVANWPTDHPLYCKTCDGKTLDDAWGRFRTYIDEFGPFYRDYHRIWQSAVLPDIWQRCQRYFRKLYSAPKHFERMRYVWHDAMSVYQRFLTQLRNSTESDELGVLPSNLDELSVMIDDCLRHGRAFRRMHWSGSNSGVRQSGGVDALLVVCKLAYSYIREIYGTMSANRVIYVEPEDDEKPRNDHEYNEFLFHSGHVVLYCVNPEARESRLLSQTACFKTLWDISSQLRARRLMDMMRLAEGVA